MTHCVRWDVGVLTPLLDDERYSSSPSSLRTVPLLFSMSRLADELCGVLGIASVDSRTQAVHSACCPQPSLPLRTYEACFRKLTVRRRLRSLPQSLRSRPPCKLVGCSEMRNGRTAARDPQHGGLCQRKTCWAESQLSSVHRPVSTCPAQDTAAKLFCCLRPKRALLCVSILLLALGKRIRHSSVEWTSLAAFGMCFPTPTSAAPKRSRRSKREKNVKTD